MKFYQKLDGGTLVSAREYDVASPTELVKGQVVKLFNGTVVSPTSSEDGAVLGVAAENHSGIPDPLDPRANGTKILVIDDPEAVFQCAVPEVAAVAGSTTTLEVAELKSFAEDDFNGGYVKLVKKAEDSTNTDEIGTLRRIVDFAPDAAPSTKGILTIERGGAPCAGDVYALFPPLGFSKGKLNNTRTDLVLVGGNNLSLKVVGHDRALGKINIIFKKHFMAVNA